VLLLIGSCRNVSSAGAVPSLSVKYWYGSYQALAAAGCSFLARLVLLTCVADNARSTRTSVNALRPPAYFVTVHPAITEQTKRAPDLESRDPALAIECIHKQLSHIPSTLATESQKSRRNVLDVDADAVPAQRARRVDRGDGQL
jgi:hypothetical protein